MFIYATIPMRGINSRRGYLNEEIAHPITTVIKQANAIILVKGMVLLLIVVKCVRFL